MSLLTLFAAAILAMPVGRAVSVKAAQSWPGAMAAFFSDSGENVPGSGPLIRSLSRLDLASESGQRTLSPVTKALASMGYTPESFAQLDDVSRRIVANMAASDAQLRLSEDAAKLVAAVDQKAPLLDELIRAEQELGDVRDFYSIYVPKELLSRLTAAQEKASKRLRELRENGLLGRIEATRSALALFADDGDVVVSALTPAEAAARGLIQALGETHNRGQAKAKARKLARLSHKNPLNQELRLLVVRSLIKDARRRSLDRDHWAEEHAEDAALAVARLAGDGSELVQAAAVQGLLEGWATYDNLHQRAALEAVRRIAVGSPHLSVKSLAVAMAGGRPLLSGLVDDVARSAGGLDKLVLPDVPAPKPIPPAREKELGFLERLEEGITQHPLGAIAAAFWTALSVATSFKLGLGGIALALFAGLAVRVMGHGLFKHHPWGVWLQIGLLGHFMEIAAMNAHWSASAYLGFAAAAAVWSSVAAWTLKAHRPAWGWLLNLGWLTAALHFLLGVDWSRMFTYTIRLSGG